MDWRHFYFPALALLLLTGCPAREPAGPAVPLDAWMPLSIDGVKLTVQVALAPAEQQKGLMHRESLPADGGMLFPYRQPQPMSFWMANTPLPLDIAFFGADGVLLEIHRMFPYDTTRIRSQTREAQFALEMQLGWFRSKGILPGARLDLQLLAAALRQRGADPAAFGLDSGRRD